MFDPVLFAALMSGTAAFTPLSLFAAGEQGAWYDPSDFSTMFQDSAGTIPVTAVEQPVGLIRDKSGRGNHASQSTAASRPVLSARVNLLTYSEAIASSFITGGTATLTNNQAVTPSGAPATRFVPTTANSAHFATYSPTFGAGTFTFSLEVKAAGYPRIGLRVYDSVAYRIYATIDLTTGLPVGTPIGTVTTTDLGDGWWKISVQSEASTSNMGSTTGWDIESLPSGVTVQSAFTGDGTSGMFVSKVDIRVTNVGVGLPAYQRVGAAVSGTTNPPVTGVPDYDTSGFPLYLKFDGVDDSLATGSINFSTTDKMSVFAGLRKLGTASTEFIVETSANYASNAGAFVLGARGSATDFLAFTGGTFTPGTYSDNYFETDAVPATFVFTGTIDISQASIANESNVRLNGATTSQTHAGTDQTGNFGNYPLYIGRRGGTTSPYNGLLYSLIIRGALSTDAQIASTETYVNNLTKAY